MKSKYNKNENTLREQPNTHWTNDETPRTIPCSENNWKDGQELEEGKDYIVNKQRYCDLDEQQCRDSCESKANRDNCHFATIKLTAIPIPQDLRKQGEKFLRGMPNEEAKIALKGIEDYFKQSAVPIVAQETEDELWFEIANIISRYAHTTDRFVRNEELKSKFTIKRKL